jgi:hypothetical protein
MMVVLSNLNMTLCHAFVQDKAHMFPHVNFASNDSLKDEWSNLKIILFFQQMIEYNSWITLMNPTYVAKLD